MYIDDEHNYDVSPIAENRLICNDANSIADLRYEDSRILKIGLRSKPDRLRILSEHQD